MQFKLFIIRQSRVLLALIFFVFGFLLSLVLIINIENLALRIIAPLLLSISITTLSVYATYSNLLVKVIENEIEFYWADKFFFNFTSKQKINVESIKFLVIDKDPKTNTDILRSIWTNDTKIDLGLGKIKRYDTDSFIDFLKQNTNATVIDSWDRWKKLGLLKGAYIISTVLLYGIPGALIIAALSNDFLEIELHKWLYLIGSYLAFIPLWRELKRKLNK
ncbi:hypothetical protein [Marinoscillum pacificum]|uniref:hypothetical protein n=1 Tax=Marinoscillum pacificum TaxID=392723 RepID=UPI0021575C05|nr:hypothetical protein [Marinoscillum pacificum]